MRIETIGNATLYLGDCLEVLRTMPDCSVDSIVTDPPYGLGKEPDALAMLADWLATGNHDVKGSGFMGKAWDAFVPQPVLWRECLRVLKPGGHLLTFAGTRTHDLMTLGLRIAGFEIRDTIMWVYGSGFPKSLDVSKAIDKAAGAERTDSYIRPDFAARSNKTEQRESQVISGEKGVYTVPATEAARRWEGWGTALKPALEPITVARKPLAGTVAANVLAHGTGALNIDGCRVGLAEGEDADALSARSGGVRGFADQYVGGRANGAPPTDMSRGRWPANLIHDGSEEVLAGFPMVKGGTAVRRNSGGNTFGGCRPKPTMGDMGYDDSGSAARFFYCAKASKKDREEGLDHMPAVHRPNGNKWTDQDYRVAAGERPPSAESGPRRNTHPTVKPTDLMRYLCRLVTPPGGTVLDPFTGSGSTGKAAMLEGFAFIGIERELKYFDIACDRIENEQRQAGLAV